MWPHSASIPVVCSVTTLIFIPVVVCRCDHTVLRFLLFVVWPHSSFIVRAVCWCDHGLISVFVCVWCFLLLFCPLPATKCVGSGEILVWSLVEHVRSAGGAKKQICVEPLLCLQFPDTSVKYINMGYVTGKYGHLHQEESHLSCRTHLGDHPL